MPTYKKPTKREQEFLKHSNWIEQEYSEEAFEDSIKAWQYAVANVKDLDVNYVLLIHHFLLNRVNKRIAGKFRNCNVFIGGQKKEFLSAQKIEYDVENWINDVRVSLTKKKNNKIYKQLLAVNEHVKFEDIHPFEDGNGRVGRILYNIQRLQLNLPIHVIHEGDEQYEYYKWFQK